MAKPLQRNLVAVYGAVAEDLLQRIGDARAAQEGPPLADEIVPAGDDERVSAWLARNPQATDDTMFEMAMTRYAHHRSQGLDEDTAERATAEDLTHFRYGERMRVYTYGQIGYEEQVKEAKRLRRLAARQSTPDPLPPPPTMPSAALTNRDVALSQQAAVAPITPPAADGLALPGNGTSVPPGVPPEGSSPDSQDVAPPEAGGMSYGY